MKSAYNTTEGKHIVSKGDHVRAYDHQPCEGRDEMYVEGIVVDVDEDGKITIHVLKDTVFPIGCRLVITTYNCFMFDYPERIMIIGHTESGVYETVELIEESEKEAVDYDTAFDRFFKGCIKVYTDYCDRYDYKIRDSFTFKHSRRYSKVIRGGSVHCFVDRENGDVLKAASWNAPAKHARGNIFDAKNGLGAMREFGPAYLK